MRYEERKKDEREREGKRERERGRERERHWDSEKEKKESDARSILLRLKLLHKCLRFSLLKCFLVSCVTSCERRLECFCGQTAKKVEIAPRLQKQNCLENRKASGQVFV